MRIDEDGTYWFRQSWIGDYLMCPERARLTAFHPPPDNGLDGTDATALGTAAHSVIEHYLHGQPWDDAWELGRNELWQRIQNKDFIYVSIKTGRTMMKYLDSCVTAWRNQIAPLIGEPHPEQGIEHTFRHRFAPNWGFTGTWDYLGDTLWDWKTAGGNFALQYGPKALEKKIQPTVYTAVLANWDTAEQDFHDTEMPFQYGIMEKGPTPKGHHRTATRHVGHWRWLARQIDGIIKMYETYGPDETWPTIDTDWFCSDTWCDHWETCKGQYVQIQTNKETTKSL